MLVTNDQHAPVCTEFQSVVEVKDTPEIQNSSSIETPEEDLHGQFNQSVQCELKTFGGQCYGGSRPLRQDVYVKTPTMLKGKSQLDPQEVIRDRRVASKRIHIERVIGLSKGFKILRHSLPQRKLHLG
uniref:DDE Tnp4 domain-containing protein n=1 Tax=Magallana gigas TaxID=29159 RepID=A0A8W8IGF8_MAGGI